MHIHNPWIMKKKLNVSHLLWHTVFLRVAYTYSDCSREAYVSTRAPLSARCFVSHKNLRFLLHAVSEEDRGQFGKNKNTRVWQFLLNCHVRHVLEWSWLKSRRRKRYETTAFSKPWASLLVELPEKFSLCSALGKNHDPMAVNRCWLRILEFQLAAAPLPE